MISIYKYTFLIFLLFTTLDFHGQITNKRNYTNLEIETENCLDSWLKSNNVDWDTLKIPFEAYFVDNNISNSNDPIEKQYEDILGFFSVIPINRFPKVKKKEAILEAKSILKLNERDIITKKQLDCFIDKFIANKETIKKPSSFFAYGETLQLSGRDVPGVSHGFVAFQIEMGMDKSDYKKSLYQKTILLMFCFDLALAN